MTLALPPSMIATHELVVPRSMPMIFAIVWFPLGIAWIACLGGRLGRPMNAIWGRGPAVQAPRQSPCGRWSVALGDRDQRRAQQLLVEHEPLLEDLGHRMRRDAVSLDYAHGLVVVGVEGVARPGRDLDQAVVLGDAAKLAQDQHHAVAHRVGVRSEEHTSELQSLMRISYAVFCLKKKIKNNHQDT